MPRNQHQHNEGEEQEDEEIIEKSMEATDKLFDQLDLPPETQSDMFTRHRVQLEEIRKQNMAEFIDEMYNPHKRIVKSSEREVD